MNPETTPPPGERVTWVEAGTGIRRLAAATGISRCRLTEVRHDTCYHADRPQKRWLKTETAEKILDILPERDLVAAGAYSDARETRRLIDELLAAGLRRCEIAAALGRQGKPPALQIRKGRVRKSTEAEVRALHDLAYRGSAKLRAGCACPEWRR